MFSMFKNRLFVSVLGLIALAIVIWFVGPLVSIAGKTPLYGEVPRLLLIIICLAFWGVNNLLQQQQVSKANAALADSFSGSGSSEVAQDSQSAEEVAALQSKFNDALKVLQKDTRSKGGAGIYDLPWYIIIGPPGSGKTTALVNSGLKFPLAAQFGKEALQGVGGTRSCDWWFTDEAVMLDTAGRYTTQDSHADVDSAGWVGFLQLLKKNRKRRPINGAIIAISLQELMTQSEPQRVAQVNAMKSRLQELNKHLEVRFPVYVMFTKCDLVAGFTEFFDDLGHEERSQVWGMTFPYVDESNGASSTTDTFASEYDALLDRLNKRLLWRLQQERDPERRAKIFAFPQQMASMRDIVKTFMDDVFSGNRYQDSVLLRGAYFCSGTQEGAPIDRVMGALSRTFGVSQQSVGAHAGQGRSYFMSRLLKDVIFEEAELVGINKKLEWQRRIAQRLSYGGAVALTIIMIFGWVASFTRNEVYVYRAKEAVEEFRSTVRSNRDIANFDQLVTRLNAARDFSLVYAPFKDGVPFLMGLGLYQGAGITKEANGLYKRELEQLLAPTIQYRLEQQIRDSNDADLLYEGLKTYLMLGDKDRRDPELINLWTAYDWQTIYPDDAELQGQLQNHVSAMIDLDFKPLQLNGKVVDETRRYLQAVPRSELMYGLMKRDYLASDVAPLRVGDVMGPKARGIFKYANEKGLDHGVSSFFTYDGYHKQFKSLVNDITELANQESWILDSGDKSFTAPELEALKKDIESLYFSDYIEAWDGLLSRLRIAPFDNMRTAADALNVLAAPNSPMIRMLDSAVYHTSLASGGLAGKAKSAVSGEEPANRLSRLFNSASQAVRNTVIGKSDNPVELHFTSLRELMDGDEDSAAPVDKIMSLFAQLYGQYDALSMGIGGDIRSTAQGSGSADVLTRVQIEASRKPEPLRSWMRQISSGGRKVVMLEARNEINELWKTDVLPFCRRAVEQRYPFYKNSRRDITLADFGRLFGPEGLFENFFNENLKPFIKNANGAWSWKSMAGSTIGMSNETLEQFRRASVIKETYFFSGGKMPAVSFGVKPVYLDANVRSFNLDIEGQMLRYRHGPTRLMRANWPSSNSTGMVRIEFIDDSGASIATSYEGPWALFRLFDDASINLKSNDIAHASFVNRGRKSVWEFRAETVSSPFNVDAISQFRCAEEL